MRTAGKFPRPLRVIQTLEQVGSAFRYRKDINASIVEKNKSQGKSRSGWMCGDLHPCHCATAGAWSKA